MCLYDVFEHFLLSGIDIRLINRSKEVAQISNFEYLVSSKTKTRDRKIACT